KSQLNHCRSNETLWCFERRSLLMRILRPLLTALTISAVFVLTVGVAHAQLPFTDGSCQPGIQKAFQGHSAAYTAVNNALQPSLSSLTQQLRAVVDETTYEALLNSARTIATAITNGRVVITVPDGTVVLDTARTDDPNNTLPVGNSYQHFLSKTVNENHNS